jgi:uncharacterized protein with PQ loop repeat
MLIDLLGYSAQGLFILASAAQALKAYQDGHSDGISHGLVWSLTIGFIFMMIYLAVKLSFDPVLMFGYIGQLAFCLIIAKYKYFPRKK